MIMFRRPGCPTRICRKARRCRPGAPGCVFQQKAVQFLLGERRQQGCPQLRQQVLVQQVCIGRIGGFLHRTPLCVQPFLRQLSKSQIVFGDRLIDRHPLQSLVSFCLCFQIAFAIKVAIDGLPLGIVSLGQPCFPSAILSFADILTMSSHLQHSFPRR